MHEKSEWFETWFDSKYYHLLYNNRDGIEAENFILNLLDYLNLEQNDRVLDLGCGKGRHSLQLQKNKLKVTGMDLSQESITYAKEKYGNQNLNFIQGDMRMPFGSHTYDAIFNLFTSFGYSKDKIENQNIIQNVKQALKGNGIFIQDYLNVDWVKNTLVEEEIQERGDIVFHVSRQIEDGFVQKNITFEDQGKSYHFQEKVSLLKLEDFQKMYDKSGLQVKAIFGSYDLKPFDAEESARLILISQAN